MGAARVIAVVGATATGKTALGEALAVALGGELVCADSRQVYRELDLGTGKPSPAERAARPHHLFEALELGERASAGWYARAAREVCAAIHARDRAPVLVGGSGLYLAAARRGLSLEPPHDPQLRQRLREEARTLGSGALHRRLAASDPETAARLDPRDAQRVMRALEVLAASGRPLSWWHRQEAGPAVQGEWRVVELVVPPAELAERIAARTRWMFAHGLIEETRALVERGHGDALRDLRAVGYDEALALLAGRMSRAEAEARTCLRTRQLAKRQRTWFRHQVDAARFEAAGGSPADWLAAVRDALQV
ncbi:MAG: tRNA (adenosine(37)-N6)-dimethylallyltransferase MiaA [Candidatus Eisenbacteria bacterium RBG_16_71_46]|nr:MAG: tRNA (adenosine(37)-N6)-dimethylallyltransferase MiaA [Candidatus Eisenbacteria bacterium RBG_16_71_46]